jgi:hypothetical protein
VWCGRDTVMSGIGCDCIAEDGSMVILADTLEVKGINKIINK